MADGRDAMSTFGRTIVGSIIGRTIFAVVALIAVSVGFGPDYWVRVMAGWATDPLGLTLNVARLVFILVATVFVVILGWPWVKSLIWPEAVCHVENIVLAAGLTPQTTSPVLLIADVKTANDRLRILVEYSYFSRGHMNWAGWLKSRQVLLADLPGTVRGQQIRIPIVTCKLDGSAMWWGGENDSEGNLIQKSHKYWAQLRFTGGKNEEQTYRFCLLRTSMSEAPYIVEVFTEQDLERKS